MRLYVRGLEVLKMFEREAGQGVSKCALGSERSEGLAQCPQEAVAGGERAGGSTGL